MKKIGPGLPSPQPNLGGVTVKGLESLYGMERLIGKASLAGALKQSGLGSELTRFSNDAVLRQMGISSSLTSVLPQLVPLPGVSSMQASLKALSGSATLIQSASQPAALGSLVEGHKNARRALQLAGFADISRSLRDAAALAGSPALLGWSGRGDVNDLLAGGAAIGGELRTLADAMSQTRAAISALQIGSPPDILFGSSPWVGLQRGLNVPTSLRELSGLSQMSGAAWLGGGAAIDGLFEAVEGLPTLGEVGWGAGTDGWVLPGSPGSVDYPTLTAANFRVVPDAAWYVLPFVVTVAVYGAVTDVSPELLKWASEMLNEYEVLWWLLGIAGWTSERIARIRHRDR